MSQLIFDSSILIWFSLSWHNKVLMLYIAVVIVVMFIFAVIIDFFVPLNGEPPLGSSRQTDV